MKFLIQDSVFDTSDKTVEYLRSEGHTVVEFSSKFSVDESHFFRGSLEVAVEHEDNENLEMYFDTHAYDYTSFASEFPYGLLNDDFEVYDRESFVNSKDEIISKFGIEDFITGSDDQIIFVRPDSGLKSFSGQVIDETFWKAYQNMFRRREVEDIVVSSPKEIGDEFRFVVFHNDLPKEGSYYIKNGEVHYERIDLMHPAYRFARRIAEDNTFKPDNGLGCYTMDVVETPEGFRVVEINAFSTSDLYDTNREKVFNIITW